MRTLLTAFVVTLTAMSANAAEITIPLADKTTEIETIKTSYACGDDTINVTYINAGSVSLALLTIENQLVVASNVLSASGARYAGSHYIWWSKGDSADLYDLMQDDGETSPSANCKQTN